MSDTADFFRGRLDEMIDLRHPLAVLVSRMPWQEIEASIAHRFAKQLRAAKTLADVVLFGGTDSGFERAHRLLHPAELLGVRIPPDLNRPGRFSSHRASRIEELLPYRWTPIAVA